MSSPSSTGLPPNFPSPQALAHAASAYRQPAPPPQLPSVQLAGRHQDPSINTVAVEEVEKQQKQKQKAAGAVGDEAFATTANGSSKGVGVVRCHEGRAWQERDRHAGGKLNRFAEQDIDGFVDDMGMVLRREYDCWVEQCWQEAFHHLFTHTLPNLIIHLIMTGATPAFLRKKIVYGGQQLDHLFQSQMLHLLYEELELRLSGSRPHDEPGPSNAHAHSNSHASVASKFSPLAFPTPSHQPAGGATSLLRDGVCFHNLAYHHGIPEEEDDHGPCLCQLTTCLSCFHQAALSRRGPVSLLPYELKTSRVAEGWLGGVETEAQARQRHESLRRKPLSKTSLPEGKGFAQIPKVAINGNSHGDMNGNGTGNGQSSKPPMIFPHPQMTDVLAVEEHLRWRLKEMGASDPAVESRYGPSTNAPAALDGIDLSGNGYNVGPATGPGEDGVSDDGTASVNSTGTRSTNTNGKMVRVAKGRGKLRRMIVNPNGTVPKSKDSINSNNSNGSNGNINNDKDESKKAVVYLPKEWVDEEPGQRNTAIVLTFRHFVKLLHQISMAASPFSYPSYAKDIDELQRVHPIALYRRLAEPSVQRRSDVAEARAWMGCMDKWAEELGGKERKKGNDRSNERDHSEAVRHYTRAISLDGKKTVYYSNRAIALNNLGRHDLAENDCTHLLIRDPKNQKALYQRALARRGMGRLAEAELDLMDLLRMGGDNESARNLLGMVRRELLDLTDDVLGEF
ncbi:serine/threonine protein phosphatase 5 phosphatase [Kwoniella heveanensis CBS 569]|nr:serine/threonine protein phosphatase 5 phosphatase [Kwoniella heveanensis CBS 569]